MATPQASSEQAIPARGAPAVAPPAAPSLAQQYDLDEPLETGAQGETSAPRAAPPEAGHTPPEEPARRVPPKDPDTGRFISQEQAQQVQHAQSLVRRARQLGLSDEDIAEQTVESLPELVYHLQQQRNYAGWERERQERELDNGRSTTSLPEQQTAPGTLAPESAPAPEPTESTLDPTVYDPGLVAAFNGLAHEIKDLKAENAELRKHFQALAGREVQRENLSTAQFIDRLFNTMGKEWGPVFGQGFARDMQRDQPEYMRRLAVIQATGCNSARDPSFPSKLRAAAEKMFGKPRREAPSPRSDLEEMETSNPDALRRWDDAALARPTQRNGPPEPKGEKRAIRAVAAQLREQYGSEGAENDEAIKDGFFP